MAFYLAIDQGTTSCRSIIFNEAFEEVSRAQATFPQLFPQPGWVEHDPNVILDTQTATIRRALNEANLTPDDIIAAGITNQRETTVVWNRHTGIPVYPAIVW
ncbi:MAG TPA: glycerol kinase, partial [Bacteroidetes bacterium]|nr:glycerol kinase [Bacteroidota bacterium]